MQTSTYSLKRKALGDLTNCSIDEEIDPLKTDHILCNDAVEMMPNITGPVEVHHMSVNVCKTYIPYWDGTSMISARVSYLMMISVT